jgi:cyclopropane fatty-acyl-phospholipid synthase-like methyltransferase
MSLPGIDLILSHPQIYRRMRLLIGGNGASQNFVNTFIRPRTGEKILDIGCGPGDILEFLPAVDYWGFDLNEEYINYARKRFSNRGQFFCKNVSRDAIPGENIFDIVIAFGVFHHLSDDEAGEMFELAYTLLKPDGRFITIDGVYVPHQSYLVHLLLSEDRGNYVRTQEQYRLIAQKKFSDIRLFVRHDLLWIPYTHIIMECTK